MFFLDSNYFWNSCEDNSGCINYAETSWLLFTVFLSTQSLSYAGLISTITFSLFICFSKNQLTHCNCSNIPWSSAKQIFKFISQSVCYDCIIFTHLYHVKIDHYTGVLPVESHTLLGLHNLFTLSYIIIVQFVQHRY